MLSGLVIFFHVVVCILLAALILVQSGKGGGLTEQFAPAGEMFGTQTSGFLVKGTSIFAALFLITCLGLAVISAKKDESLMSSKVAPLTAVKTDVTEATGEVDNTGENVSHSTTEATQHEIQLKQEIDAATKELEEAAPAQPAEVK